MKSNAIIDYLTFTIKTDEKNSNAKEVTKNFIFGFLQLPQDDFFDIGRKGHYCHCYTAHDINVYQAYHDRIKDMGFCVSMSGQGCRYFESRLKDGEFADVWREFLIKLRALTLEGYSVNISRIDIAIDDYSGILNLSEIERSARAGEIVSQFRLGRSKNTIEVSFDKGLVSDAGTTVSFGSRKSATYCRFYDKKQEQLSKFKNDKEQVARLQKIDIWVRMEFEFKREQAVKIVNTICDTDNFTKYYAEIVNGYIRFVDFDNTNTSRRTSKNWWSEFLGTVRRCKLTVGDFSSFGYDRMVNYYDKYLSTTVFTMLSRMSPIDFLSRTYNNAVNRLKTKHKAIIQDISRTIELGASDLWGFLNPVPYGERVAYEP